VVEDMLSCWTHEEECDNKRGSSLVFKENFVSHFFYFPLTKKLYLFFLYFFWK